MFFLLLYDELFRTVLSPVLDPTANEILAGMLRCRWLSGIKFSDLSFTSLMKGLQTRA